MPATQQIQLYGNTVMDGNTNPAIAAIDAGTNSFHLIVANVSDNGEMQILDRSKESVRLGKSDNYGDFYILPEKAVKRCRATIERFADIAKSYNAKIYAVATSGIREAKNRENFISEIANATGVNLEIIPGQEECRLIYNGVIHSLDVFNEKILVLDIGGGSTETVVGFKGETEFSISTKIGSLRLTNMFFPDSVSTPQRCEECRKYIRWMWSPTIERLKRKSLLHFVGTSGTIAAIAKIAMSLKGIQFPETFNSCIVDKDDILSAISLITNAQNLQERKAIPGMEPNRADIILGGCLILEYAIKELDIKELTYSSFALREGLVFDIHNRLSEPESRYNPINLRRDAVQNMCKKYRVNLRHAEYVKNISCQLFSGLQDLHGLSNDDCELLGYASMLHDVGYFISHDQHHKHSYYLIRKSLLPGFTNEETEMMGLIARYHRKGLPDNSQSEYSRLSAHSKYVLGILAGILRISEGIDRRRLQLIKGIKHIDISGDVINIVLLGDAEKSYPDLELWGANHRTDLLEAVLDRQIKLSMEN